MNFDRAIIFVGPTIGQEEIQAKIPLERRPPASRGDLYLAAIEEPKAILLVDGVFEDVAAVFHKEILWALAQGIHVFGASSLGALRAAEVDTFGMVGWGSIYEAYRDGTLERDDAVAVLHGPAELGWPLLTRALVDIEATLCHAQRWNVIDDRDRETFETSARRLFWKERTYEAMVANAQEVGWKGDKDRVVEWLRRNGISQKRADCLALIEHVSANWHLLDTPFDAQFRFEHTAAWQSLVSELSHKRSTSAESELDRVLAELRSSGEYERLELEAMLLALVDDDVSRQIASPRTEEFAAAARDFRRERNLFGEADVLSWLESNRLSHSEYTSMVSDYRKLARIRERTTPQIRKAIIRVLRVRGFLAVEPGR